MEVEHGEPLHLNKDFGGASLDLNTAILHAISCETNRGTLDLVTSIARVITKPILHHKSKPSRAHSPPGFQ